MSEMLRGVVRAFDAAAGLGEVEATDGTRFGFHCIEIADGTRTIEAGTTVTFQLLCKLGRYEAAGLAPE